MNKITLFCFPYAGGSGSIFHEWKKPLSANFDLKPIHYAGRGKRFNEPFYNNMNEAVTDICKLISSQLDDNDYIFFGHSMGGLIAYEVCRKLIENGYKPPLHMFISGIRPPDMIRMRKIHNLPDSKFRKELKKLNRTPREVFENKQLMDIFIPILRSDFKLIEKYKFESMNSKITSNITVMYGTEDNMTKEEMMRWSNFTTKKTQICKFQGGHFFINDKFFEVIDYINQKIVRGEDYYE
ncbi:thioesterase domain-containing protein [Priestia filamentosa]|uniref:thioesterase II family protein n=1 Tax=Priestia filamentosa TaxID=1402861 RepID=UPI00398319FE